MKNKEQLLNKENWIQYLNLADDGGLTNNAKANDIVSKIQQAIDFIPCCTELKTVKQGENLILDNKFDVQVVIPESSVLIKHKEKDRLIWVDKQRLKRK
jgi:hypothetical protein